MADRITIRHLTPAFHHFIGELGGTTTEAARRAGQDIAGTYRLEKLFQGRYRVIRYAANGTGEHTPFGLTGHPARAMYDMLTFATDALREARRLAATEDISRDECDTCAELHAEHMPDDPAQLPDGCQCGPGCERCTAGFHTACRVECDPGEPNA